MIEHFLGVNLGEIKTWNRWKLDVWNFHGVPLVTGYENLVLAMVTASANYCKQ